MTPYTLSLIGVAVLCAALILLAWSRRGSSLVGPYLVVSIAIVVWTVAYAWEFEATTIERMMLATRIQYLGVVTIPPAALAFALVFTGRPGYVNPRTIAGIAIIPLTMLVLVWTNGRHGWAFSHVDVIEGSGWSLLALDRGGFFWVFVVFSYGCLAAALGLVGAMAVRSTGIWRRQAVLVLVGMLPPILANVARISGLDILAPLDLTVFGFAIEAVALGFAALNVGLLSIVPVARDRVVAHIDVGILVADRDGVAVDLNPAGRAILGVEGDVVGRDAVELLGPFAHALTETGNRLTISVPAAGGGEGGTFACSRVRIRDRRNTVVAQAVVMRDVSDLAAAHRAVVDARDRLEERVKERTAELEESNRELRSEMNRRLESQRKERLLRDQLARSQRMEAVGRLAGGIAHDFNNLLAAVLGYTELALEDVAPGSETHGNLEEVRRASERARDLVGQLLAYSRLADGQREPVRAGALIEAALGPFRASAPDGVRIEVRVEGGLPPVVGDRTQLEQALHHVLDNAIRAVGDGGTVTVSARTVRDFVAADTGPAADWIEISVSDDGPGMDGETKERAFDPFFSTRDRSVARGLSLAVVHGIVIAHRGTVSIDSEPGRGTTVTLFLRAERPTGLDPRAPTIAGLGEPEAAPPAEEPG